MNYTDIKITTTKAEKILLDLFQIKGIATELPGEVDFNYRIKATDGEFVLKISRPGEDIDYLSFQQELLQYLENLNSSLTAPIVIKDISGNVVSEIIDTHGNLRYIRLISWISGRIWSSVNPQLNPLRFSLGVQCGLLTQNLQGFDHPKAHRHFVWDVSQSLWTKDYIDLFKNEERETLILFQQQFENVQKNYTQLRKSIVHNDANDNNVIVSNDLISPTVTAPIDYGDSIYTQIINDLAITCAYAIMEHNDPLEAALPIIKGYHSSFPLEEEELSYLYITIAMRLVITVTKSAINKQKEPDNAYLLVSEKPAWEVLNKWKHVHPSFAEYSFRDACGYHAHPNQKVFEAWASKQSFQLIDVFPSVAKNLVHHLDLSVSSGWIGHQEDFNNLDLFQFKIDQLQKKCPKKIIAGGYLEPRPLYTSTEYDTIGNYGRESRTVHLGIDYWLPEYTPIHACMDSEVVIAVNDSGEKEYGGLVVLKHHIDRCVFYTLYGHLTVESATSHKVGDVIKKGGKIGELGNPTENGNWASHLHFQIMLDLMDYELDFPGVTYQSKLNVWKSICPDPNLLFKCEALQSTSITSNESLVQFRKKHLGKSLSLQYKVPIKMVRGAGQFMMDQYGRKYLDTVNNVAHVGHEHYHVVEAGQKQMALINTNSRYLHENINLLSEELLKTLPPALNVLHFVNSGSEANELAIRMAKAYTGEQDIIASEVGYHGNTNMCVDISSYKFDGKGGKGAPMHTHIFPLPDTFRGTYTGPNSSMQYVNEVQQQISKIQDLGRNVAAFIIEPIISCGGQIELPEDFLKNAYSTIRAAGGLCISDEVQTGCGRMGKTFWGFQLHHVVPDIVTIGKPLGNGHPIAAVACTQEVATKFANGMEYFNTFGGNPVSCAIGKAVLKTVNDEKLQKNALLVGAFLKKQLKALAKEHPIIGDVRGQGLFLGIEFVDKDKKPLAKQTSYLANRMKDYGILMSTDGPDHNVLKIKPPMVFNKSNAEELLQYLSLILKENYMQFY